LTIKLTSVSPFPFSITKMNIELNKNFKSLSPISYEFDNNIIKKNSNLEQKNNDLNVFKNDIEISDTITCIFFI
jgi:hypothetical protein